MVSPAEAMRMPNAPSQSGSDRFRVDAHGSVQCESAVSNSTALQMGVYGSKADNEESGYNHYKRQGDDKGVYMAITMPLGKPKARIDCTVFAERQDKIQEMDMERRLLEHELTMAGMKAELNRIQQQTNSF